MQGASMKRATGGLQEHIGCMWRMCLCCQMWGSSRFTSTEPTSSTWKHLGVGYSGYKAEIKRLPSSEQWQFHWKVWRPQVDCRGVTPLRWFYLCPHWSAHTFAWAQRNIFLEFEDRSNILIIHVSFFVTAGTQGTSTCLPQRRQRPGIPHTSQVRTLALNTLRRRNGNAPPFLCLSLSLSLMCVHAHTRTHTPTYTQNRLILFGAYN